MAMQLTNLPKRLKRYCTLACQLAARPFAHSVLAVGVFGSIARGSADDFSDADILLICKDGTSKKTMNTLIASLKWLEKFCGLSPWESGITGQFLAALAQTTGMFKSFFAVNVRSWKKRDFSKVFGVASLSRILAPRDLVVNNVRSDLLWLWENPRITSEEKASLVTIRRPINIGTTQWIQSFIMTEMTAIGALFLLPFVNQSTRFSMEAIKWSLFTYKSFLEQKSRLMDDRRRLWSVFPGKGLPQDNYLKKISFNLALRRKNYHRDPFFSLDAVMTVFRIHLNAADILRRT